MAEKQHRKTYREAIDAYGQILEEKKKERTTIGRQFEYNTYIRDFFADTKDAPWTRRFGAGIIKRDSGTQPL